MDIGGKFGRRKSKFGDASRQEFQHHRNSLPIPKVYSNPPQTNSKAMHGSQFYPTIFAEDSVLFKIYQSRRPFALAPQIEFGSSNLRQTIHNISLDFRYLPYNLQSSSAFPSEVKFCVRAAGWIWHSASLSASICSFKRASISSCLIILGARDDKGS